MLNKIRSFHRHFNFKSTPIDRKKCESSLCHSLRRSPEADSVKQLEWNPSLSNNNLIYYRGRIQALDDFNEEDKQEILFEIAPLPRLRDHKKLQTQQRQYRAKIKKAVVVEHERGNVEASDFLAKIIKQTDRVNYSQIDKFARLTMTRSKQRVNMLEVYLNAHNQICTRPPNENGIYIQEGIFKIPHRWQVGSDVIPLTEYMEFTKQFLEHHYPNHTIESIIGHDDERDESENTGLHTHYYLNGKNNQTGQYDLRKRQIEIVNKFLTKEGSVHDSFPNSGKLSHQQSKALGHHYQRLVQDYTNEHLLKPKGFVAEFADETEKASTQYQHMISQAKLPKSQREFNFYNRQLTQCKQHLESLKEDTSQLNEQKEVIVPMLATAMQELDNADIYLQEQQSQLERLYAKKIEAQSEIDGIGMRYLALQHTIANKHDELNSVEDALANAEQNLKSVNRESKQLLEGIIESSFMLLFAKSKRNPELVKKFTQQLTKRINQRLPEPLEPILNGVVALAGDELSIER